MQTAASKTRIQLKNILYTTDFSNGANAAFPYAVDLARHFGARVSLLHVRPIEIYSYAPVETWATLGETADTEAHRKAAELLRGFPGMETEVIIREGGVWESIAPLIQQKQFDLIVTGTSGRSGVEKLLLGSVAEEIFRRASCPVLTVGPFAVSRTGEHGQFSKILYASDFGPASRTAAAHAISLAQEYQAHLTLLHVIDNATTGDLVRPEELILSSVRLLDIAEESKFWCKPEPIALLGEPAQKILEVADDINADLIVLGAREPGRFTSVATHLPTATAHKVVSQAICPVLTVRG